MHNSYGFSNNHIMYVLANSNLSNLPTNATIDHYIQAKIFIYLIILGLYIFYTFTYYYTLIINILFTGQNLIVTKGHSMAFRCTNISLLGLGVGIQFSVICFGSDMSRAYP